MEHIRAISLFPSISASALDSFKQVAAELLALAHEEPGTLQYDWFFNSDETQCIVHETYVDSDAVLAHIGNVGDRSGRIIELGGGFRPEIFGDPSEELRAALVAFGAPIFTYAQGK